MCYVKIEAKRTSLFVPLREVKELSRRRIHSSRIFAISDFVISLDMGVIKDSKHMGKAPEYAVSITIEELLFFASELGDMTDEEAILALEMISL